MAIRLFEQFYDGHLFCRVCSTMIIDYLQIDKLFTARHSSMKYFSNILIEINQICTIICFRQFNNETIQWWTSTFFIQFSGRHWLVWDSLDIKCFVAWFQLFLFYIYFTTFFSPPSRPWWRTITWAASPCPKVCTWPTWRSAAPSTSSGSWCRKRPPTSCPTTKSERTPTCQSEYILSQKKG